MKSRSLIKLISLFAILSLCNIAASFGQQKYQRIYFEADQQQLLEISGNGATIDHLVKSGNGFEAELSVEEVHAIQQAGCYVKILIEDLSVYFADLFKDEPVSTTRDAPENFHLGSHAGNLTLQELWSELDSMHQKFPSLITAKEAIGYSIENRPIYMVKISDNAASDEDETEVEFDAMHHAREPVSMMQLLYYAWYLLENYNVDSLSTYLVNNREIYFIPCVNPDGYYYNQVIEPGGGGMWRKNRRLNSDGSYGVDLNRNYGYQWGYDDSGSSSDPEDDTYRGTGPFSEPETQALRDFASAHQFAASVSCHTSGDLLIFPWGYTGSSCPEIDWFSAYSDKAVEASGYDYGNVIQTLGYYANGTTFDWMYGEQTTKEKVYGFTPETGYSFWPSPNDIEELCENILQQNIFLTWIPDAYFLGDPSMQSVTYASSVAAEMNVMNIGLATGEVTCTLEAVSPFAVDNTDTIVFSNVASMASDMDYLQFELDPFTPWGEVIPVHVTTSFGPFHFTETFSVTAYLSITGIADVDLNQEFSLFPNPTNGSVSLRAATQEAVTVDLFDIAGKKLLSQEVKPNSSLTLNNFLKGIYFYTIKVGNESTASRKLVIQ